MLHGPKFTQRRARALRRTLSLPEVPLWQVLRKRPAALKFPKQHPAGHYMLDFFARSVDWPSRSTAWPMNVVKCPSVMPGAMPGSNAKMFAYYASRQWTCWEICQPSSIRSASSLAETTLPPASLVPLPLRGED